MTTHISSPLYLYLDTKTEAYPNLALGKRSRTQRYTQFSFQTVNCDYFVDVTVFYADAIFIPGEISTVRHEVKIRITDMTDEGMGDDTKQQNFLPNDGQPVSLLAARRLADLHLSMYVRLN